MNKHVQLIMLLTILLCLTGQTVFAEDTATTTALPPETAVEETAPEEAAVPAGQEVEVNEDNYRQFMELKNAQGQRNIQPENAFKTQSGLQKLDKLPEKSQKHLRNQLREIIVAGEQWQPGDEDTDYPYVPSEAASTDPSLNKQEAEAWGELVDGYNKREAEIYENSSRSQAAMASEGAAGDGAGNGEASVDDSAGQGSAGQQAGQQNGDEESRTASKPPADPPQDSSSEAESISTTGASQNALEYLLGKDVQADDAAPPNPTESEGTLSIEDLLNAQGVDAATGPDSSSTDAGDTEGSEQNENDKDGR